MVNNQHYLYRMTVLVAITSLASVVSHETLYQTILPAVVSCAKDKVIVQTHLICCQAGIKHPGCGQISDWAVAVALCAAETSACAPLSLSADAALPAGSVTSCTVVVQPARQCCLQTLLSVLAFG